VNDWEPVAGAEVAALLQHANNLNEAERTRILADAHDILRRCPRPDGEDGRITGLVVGHVQSGKTLSFTTVAALCRDNQYRLVIVIAGTSIPLYEQSKGRLLDDLGYGVRHGHRWAHFSNPRREQSASIQAILNGWRDARLPMAAKQTVLVTVMKHAGHIRHLTDMLRALDLTGVTTIVIDDEADQAGLNTLARQARLSSTNRAIVELRDSTSSHGYLEYTATPQALLLIQIIDALSPQFAKVLEAGPEYVGLHDFFGGGRRLVTVIPDADVPGPQNTLTGPPQSFLDALALFYIGVVVGLERDNAQDNRSMMVHPSRLRDVHGDFFAWAQAVKREWITLLAAEQTEPDRTDLIHLFRDAYDTLAQTDQNLPSFDRIVELVPWAIEQTDIQEVNAARGKTPLIDWARGYPFILVGGQAMDRGFTVPGLTVTYMPRGLGVGNADTIQQRARFLGYKRRFLGVCRVFVADAVARAYEAYEEHEESVREQLIEAGDDLQSWRRRFILDPRLAPTRRSVIVQDIVRGVPIDQWFTPRYSYENSAITQYNRNVMDAFLRTRTLNGRIEAQPALLDVPLSEVLAELLVEYRLSDPRDSARFDAVLLQLQSAVDGDAGVTCDVVILRTETGEPRVRDRTTTRAIKQLFQGPRQGGGGYVGDGRVRRDGHITIQLHRVSVKDNNVIEWPDVPVVAVYLPPLGAPNIVTQPNNVRPL
jgi:hypothetical protein